MSTRRTGIIAAIALAAGLAIGTVATASAADPTFGPGGRGMMGGSGGGPGSTFGPGMMGGSGGGPASSYGPGMMNGLTPADRDKFLEQCDEIHDAMLKAWGGSPEPAPTR